MSCHQWVAELRSKLNYLHHATTPPLACWFDPRERRTSCLNALKAIPDSECLGSRNLKWLIIRHKWEKLTKCTCPAFVADLSNENLQGWDLETFIFLSASPSALDYARVWGSHCVKWWERSLPKIRVYKSAIFYAWNMRCSVSVYLNNEWVNFNEPFEMYWKYVDVSCREFILCGPYTFFFNSVDVLIKFFSVSVCSPLGLLNTLKAQFFSLKLCRF